MTTTYFETTLEELGRNEGVCVEASVAAMLTPGEPMVRYYRDGSGHPGSPPEAELLSAAATEITGENYQWQRNERPDWFDLLDKIIGRIVDARWSEFSERAFESACTD